MSYLTIHPSCQWRHQDFTLSPLPPASMAADCGTTLKIQVPIIPMPVNKLPLVPRGLAGTRVTSTLQDSLQQSLGKSNWESQTGAGIQQLTCSGWTMVCPFQTSQQAHTDMTVTLLSVTCRDMEPRGTHSSLVVRMLISKKHPALLLVFVLLRFLPRLLILWASLKRLTWMFWAFATFRQLFLLLCCRYLWMNCSLQAIYSTKIHPLC